MNTVRRGGRRRRRRRERDRAGRGGKGMGRVTKVNLFRSYV